MKTIVDLVEEQKEYLLEKDTAAKQAVEANIAPVEADASSASRAYVVGEQLFLNDVLYDVTSPISVGDAIVVGTNITAANKLSADIKSKIDDLYSKNQTLTSAFANNVNANGSKNVRLRFAECLDYVNYAGTNPTSSDWASYFTINDDDTITIKATPSGRKSICALAHLPAGKYIMNGCPSGGSATTFMIWFLTYDSGSEVVFYEDRGGTPTEVTLSQDTNVVVRCDIYASATVNQVFKPMICLSTDYVLDSSYVAPAKTNHQLTEDSVTWTDYAKSGAVNVIPFDLAKAKAANTLGTWSGNTYTANNVTFAFNDDGTLVVNTSGATARTTFQYYEAVADVWLEKNRVYKASAFNEIVKDGTTGFYIQLFRGGSPYPRIALFNEQPFVVDNQYFGISKALSVQIVVENGTVVTNQTIKPIISDAAYNGGHVPYAKTNKELTEDVAIKSSEITVNTTNVDSENIARNYVNKSAGVKVLVLQAKPKTNLVAGTTYELGTVPSDYLPTLSTGFVKEDVVTSGGLTALIEVSNGKLKLTPRANNIPASGSFIVSVTYI